MDKILPAPTAPFAVTTGVVLFSDIPHVTSGSFTLVVIAIEWSAIKFFMEAPIPGWEFELIAKVPCAFRVPPHARGFTIEDAFPGNVYAYVC